MGTWFWLNIPLAAVIFLAVTGIPLWMAFKHPDERRAPAMPGYRRAPSPAARRGRPRCGSASSVCTSGCNESARRVPQRGTRRFGAVGHRLHRRPVLRAGRADRAGAGVAAVPGEQAIAGTGS
jgi:hypothetical protein